MNVTVYNTSTDPYHVVKDIANKIGDYSGNVRGSVSVDRPIIEIEDTITTGNYCYIDTFARFYWIVDRTVLRTGLTQLSLRSDPLMSFHYTGQLQTLPIYVTRSEQFATEQNGNTGCNTYIPDRTVQKTARTYSIVHIDTNVPKFEYPENGLTAAYVLGVIG